MKSNIFLRSALLGLQASLSTPLHIPSAADSAITYPTRKIGNVNVVDTEIVREAQAFARNHSSDVVWNHIVRGWLYGSLIIAHNKTLRTTVDAEAHAMAAILHDLGWDQTPNSTVVSTDRRFEVDGAIGARNFINSHNRKPNEWDTHRVQLVWDSIALHTQRSIYEYKQDTVAVTGLGILIDFEGPAQGVTQEEYDAVIAAFPKVEFEKTVNQTFVWLCQTKPETTYDTFMQPWGDNYVANYSAEGQRVIDIISALPQ